MCSLNILTQSGSKPCREEVLGMQWCGAQGLKSWKKTLNLQSKNYRQLVGLLKERQTAVILLTKVQTRGSLEKVCFSIHTCANDGLGSRLQF